MSKDQSSEAGSERSKLLPFPAGIPLPHHARDWERSLESVRTTVEGLVDVHNGKVPPGLFPRHWPDSSLARPPAPPEDASWSDKLKYRDICDRIERRKAENADLDDKRAAWWRSKLHE